MSRTIRNIIIALLLIFVSAGAAEPKRPTVTMLSKIDAVTVYPDQALVTRKAQAKLTPGGVSVLFHDLPENLLEDSVRVSGNGSASASITDIRIGRGSAIDEIPERLSALKKTMEELDTNIKALDDRVEILEKKSEFLSVAMNIKAPSKENGESIQKKGVMEWPRMLTYFDEQLSRIAFEKRKIMKEKKDLQDKKNACEYELNQYSSLQKKERRTVQVDLAVTRPGEEEFLLTYMVPGPSWSPVYELRIASDKKEARLACQAMVRQQTGEDWEDAFLFLTTSRPNESKEVPELKTWRVGLADSTYGMISGIVKLEDGTVVPGVEIRIIRNGMTTGQSVTTESGGFLVDRLNPGDYDLKASLAGFKTTYLKNISVRPGQVARIDVSLRMATIMEEITVSAKPRYVKMKDENKAVEMDEREAAATKEEELVEGEMSFSEGDTATSFTVDSRQTVLSGEAPQKVTAAVIPVEVEKEYISVPKLEQTAYMQARFLYNGGFTLASGRCSLFLDNGYAANIMLPRTSSGEEMRINVGAVPGIRVKYERLENKRSESGLLSKTVQLVREFQITLESFLKQPVSVTVLDQLPVTESKEVDISMLQVTPEPEKAAVEKDEKPEGELRWQINLAPREKKAIRFKFSISHPKKKPLVGIE
jgi:hypothetical protein